MRSHVMRKSNLAVSVQVVPDNYQYSRLALFIKEKTSLTEESLPGEGSRPAAYLA